MNKVQTHLLGFPRIGANRELKHALEAHWRGQSSAAELEETGRTLRARHWAQQAAAGLDFVTVGDFAFYDQVLGHIGLFGCAPARFGSANGETELARGFAMARGTAGHDATCCGGEHAHGAGAALEMRKWFDTNYHYLVPEFSEHTAFALAAGRLLGEVAEAQELGHSVKVALIGPLSFLWLGKERDSAPGFERLSLLSRLLPAYGELLARLKAQGVEWVQLDEPILGLDLPPAWRNAFESCYWQLNQAGARIMLATYFSPLEENLSLACRLPVAGLHVDGVRARHELVSVSDWLAHPKVLSVGIVDGRNIWRTDLDAAISVLAPLLEKRGGALWLAPSCSLLHVPYSLAGETALDPELRSWMAYAAEKLAELATLKAALVGRPDAAADAALAQARAAIGSRARSTKVHNDSVAQRVRALGPDDEQRNAAFAERQRLQRARLKLPDWPTTTIGSFPQTDTIRAARAAHKRGQLPSADYEKAMRAEIAHAVGRQLEIGLDVLVHGEAERNDMVEYFGEQLEGFAFSAQGWVQSYGSRCVKPPVIFGDVARPRAMTLKWATHAQSLSERPVKGMLTGPVTMLQWSFVRDDQPRAQTALQIALAIRDEVADLQQAGIGIIQIDEPAIREGLPLRRARWDDYLAWATRAFRVTAAAARDETQIHTHMCYSEFNDILPQIASMDADVLTIESSRSDMATLDGFGRLGYPNALGPGVYDIHSPRVPGTGAMVRLLQEASRVIDPARLWVNPDCGLKTRGWAETETALVNMVQAARQMRADAPVPMH
ncbi:MAG: 5-methyltetrahydropteroyltriglutamate--homocysteine S-methyltransferase [Pseudomonadota bacterium]